MIEIRLADHDVVLSRERNSALRGNAVTVIVTVYNYEKFVVETLESIAAQTSDALSLLVVEDRGPDKSFDVCRDWMARHANRFERMLLVQHKRNEGLGPARNTCFHLADTELIFVMDADNTLYPRCIDVCQEAIAWSDAAFAYPTLEVFGADRRLMGAEGWSRDKLATGNYIDAMALVRKSQWAEIGGYSSNAKGWEDFDMWCKFAERGWWGLRVPQILARYRVHPTSMLRTLTNTRDVQRELYSMMMTRHPWLRLPAPG